MKRGLLGDIYSKRRRELQETDAPLLDSDLDIVFQSIEEADRGDLARGFKGLAEAFSTPGAIQDNELSSEVPFDERRRLIASIMERM
jgi:hypothetical protein